MSRLAMTLGLAIIGILSGCAATGPGQQVAPGAKLVVVYQEAKFFESPVWDRAHGILYFDSYRKVDQFVRLDGPGKVTTMPATDGVGGAYYTRDGRIIAADCEGHRILSFQPTAQGLGEPKVLASDPSWHQPNDLTQTAAGHIYFTDPDFKGKKAGAVYHLAPDGKVTKVVEGMGCPNGIAVSNDGKTLYISDSNLKQWWSYPLSADGQVGPGTVFFKVATPPEPKRDPDGMTIDEFGNLYMTGLGGVWIVSPAGQKLDYVPVPEFCSNVRIGGPDGKTLYITCDKKVYSLALRVRSGG